MTPTSLGVALESGSECTKGGLSARRWLLCYGGRLLGWHTPPSEHLNRPPSPDVAQVGRRT